MATHRRALLLAAAAAAAAASGGGVGDESVVVTPNGAVRGLLNPAAREFRGIPFGAAARWTRAAPAPAWAPATLNATVDGPACIQNCTWAWGGCPPVQSEDCLYLNVFTPRAAANPPGTQLPVVVWIHGGDYIFGHVGNPMYNASVWAATANVVVVAIQYRLGAFGFLNDGANITGNYGMQDQQAGMAWARANAAAFGGNASSLTVVGQSAGGISVATHLVSPTSAGLFDRAVVHSDPFAIPLHTPASAVALAGTFASYAGCSGTGAAAEACLRAADAATLLTAQLAAAGDILGDLPYALLYAGLPWSPTTGTADLPLAPLAAITTPAAYVADVPVLMGTVVDEVRGLVPAGFNLSELFYDVAILTIFGLNNGGKVLSYYPAPAPAPSNFYPQFCDVGTAGTFHCAVRNATLSLAARAGRVSATWLYHYNHVLSWSQSFWGPDGTQCWGYVCHTSDVLMLFHPEYPALNATYTPEENTLGTIMQSYWGAFAATGAPGNAGGAAGAPTWPPLPPTGAAGAVPSLLLTATGVTVANATFDGAECGFWNTLGYTPY